MLDPDACGAFAAASTASRTPRRPALAGDERVAAAIAAAVEEANAHLSRVEQIKKFAILPTSGSPAATS